MRYLRYVIASAVILLSGLSQSAKGQTIELLGGNTLNGAMNGVLLGGATMALQNSTDYAPVRVGVGLGILYGAGVGIYDLSTVEIGDQFYISGIFNDGTNSSILVLLDTFYGAAAGAVISTSICLINNQPILDGLQYGTGIGAWMGFGFGLVDAFSLARRYHIASSSASLTGSAKADGLISFVNSSDDISLGLVNPTVLSHKTVSNTDIRLSYSVGLEVVNLNIRL